MSKHNLAVSGQQLQFEFIYGYKMVHKVWSSIEEVPCCVARLSVKFQGHMGQQIGDFDLKLGVSGLQL